MKTRLEQVLDRHLGHREIAIWGNPTRSLLRALNGYPHHVADQVDRERHYLVALNDDDLSDFKRDAMSAGFRYVDDYLTFDDEGSELPFAHTCFDVPVGRQTYFGDSFIGGCEEGYIASIGHFSSINSKAQIHVNHQMGMTFVSDDVQHFFNDESMAKFNGAIANDPKHPYGTNKQPVTIGSDVYIGSNAFINASTVTNIGDGAIIGAGAVVLEDVPPYAVVVGVPAKIKRYRFSDEMIEALLKVKWWEWDADQINAHIDALISPEIFMRKFGGAT